jgi:hypothetical protein
VNSVNSEGVERVMNEEYANVHICRGTNRRYIARYRWSGMRRWILIGRPRMTLQSAAVTVAKTLASNQNARFGEVILVSDWHEPAVVFEAKS